MKPKRTARRAPTPRQIKAAKLVVENVGNDKPKSQGEILREAGYSVAISENPKKIIESDSFQDLLAQVIPDDSLTEIHKRLLNTRKIEHMVFPLEHQNPDQLLEPMPIVPELIEKEIAEHQVIDNLTDQDIVDMLAEVNCKVKKIMHGETARHVWYWAHDASAQSKALELAYKVKGVIKKDSGGDSGSVNFNFGTQNFVKEVNNGGGIS